MRFLFLLMLLTVAACTRHEEAPSDFNLETGVSVIESPACAESNLPPSVTKDGSDFVVSFVGNFSCDAQLSKPFLTLEYLGRATLAFQDKQNKEFSSGCECSRFVKVRISNRLKTGDTLYLLVGSEVAGNLVMP